MLWQISSAVGIRLQGPSCLSTRRKRLGLPFARLALDALQREASPILLPRPRSPDGLRGCVSASLGQPGRFCNSSLSSRRKGGGQSQRDPPNPPITLVAPLWPEMEWFADLLLLLTQPPLALPWWDRLLRQPHFNRFHQGVHALNLHAWRLSSVSSESRAFHKVLLLRCPAVSRHPLPSCTSSSVAGVVEGASLRSMPLFPLASISLSTYVVTRACQSRQLRAAGQPLTQFLP